MSTVGFLACNAEPRKVSPETYLRPLEDKVPSRAKKTELI